MAEIFGERSSQSATAPEGGHTKKRKGRQGGRRERPGGGQCRHSADLPWNNERRSIVRNVTAGRRDDDAENHASTPEAGCLADRLARCALRNRRRAAFQDPARPRRAFQLASGSCQARRFGALSPPSRGTTFRAPCPCPPVPSGRLRSSSDARVPCPGGHGPPW